MARISCNLSCWRFAQLLECIGLRLLPNLEFWLFISLNIVSISLLLSFCDSDSLNIIFFFVTHRFLIVSSFFFSVYFLLFRLGKFCRSVFKFTSSILCHLHPINKLTEQVFKLSVIIFFTSIITIWLFCIPASLSYNWQIKL